MAPHVSVSALLRSVRRMFFAVLLALGVLAGIGGAVVAQAGREDVTRADTVVLMLDGTEDGQAARIDWIIRLYLDARISRVVLAGADPTPTRDILVARGVLEDKLLLARAETQIEQLTAVRQVLDEVRVGDAMLICEPIEALRLLKIARDQQLQLHSVPVGADHEIVLRDIIDEVGRYLVYSFGGR
jgi:hypothetical protein